ncbi:MAG: alpha/beta fold hydrolase [Polyangiaceae bacterium]
MKGTTLGGLALAAALTLPHAGCSSGAPGPSAAVSLTPCTVPGLRSPARCGAVRVFEDRAKGAGRTLDLSVVVVPALAASPKPDPIFFLAGGPGQAASSIIPISVGFADRLRESRDLVFVDQRGTGLSGALFCEVPPDDAPLHERFDSTFDLAAIERCRDDQHADLRLYGTAAATGDLDDVRKALGYETINLWGTSYGTRVALAYLRAHGSHARSAVLDSVAPMSLYLPLSTAKDASAALERLFADCAQDPACKAAFPALRERALAFIDHLDSKPLYATVRHPVTGAREELLLTRDAFLSGVRGVLYSPELSQLLPLAIDSAVRGDLGPFVALSLELESSLSRSFATGMFLSVVCTEDVPFFTPRDVESAARDTLFGPASAMEILRACAVWPRGEVPAGFRDPVESSVPVLLLSGALDPVTPPAWAEEAKKGLHRSASVVLTGAAHTAATTACARRIAGSFIEAGSPDGLDTACAGSVPRPAFFTSFAGPP